MFFTVRTTSTIEHLWGHSLWDVVRSCWDNMGLQVLHKLVESIPAPVYTGNESKTGTNQILRDSENHVQADIIIFNGGKKALHSKQME